MEGAMELFVGLDVSQRVEDLAGDDPTLRPLMAGLLAVWRSLQEQVEMLDRQLLRLAGQCN
jgi:hypothetical protein